MQAVIDSNTQMEELGLLLEDMKVYLSKVEQGCQELLVELQTGDKSRPLEILIQIMEGLSYYQKLLKSTAVLLNIDISERFCDDMSISSLFDQLCHTFTSLFEAAENKDYSLLTDIIEYDLMPVVSICRKMLTLVQVRYKERVV